jgi:hypothetical protein
MSLEEKVAGLFHSLEEKFEKENEKRLEIASELRGYAKGVAALNMISIVIKGLIVAGIFFVLLIIVLIFQYRKKKAPKRAFLPLRTRDYVNQQLIFRQVRASDKPFVLVLRSFEQRRYLPESGEFGDLDEHIRKEPDYEDDGVNVIEQVENSLDFPLHILYVGMTRSCCAKNRLTRSLFLIAEDKWFDVIEALVEKSLFVIMLPGNTKGFLAELEYIAKKNLNKTYFFLPRQQQRSSKMIDSWLKTFEEFQNEGLTLPYENNSETDKIFRIEGKKMLEARFEEVYTLHVSSSFEPAGQTLSGLHDAGLVSSDYYGECSKRFDIKKVLHDFKADDIFSEIV